MKGAEAGAAEVAAVEEAGQIGTLCCTLSPNRE